MRSGIFKIGLILAVWGATHSGAAEPALKPAKFKPTPAAKCAECARWNEPTKPFRIYGNTWYVGTAHLASVLITSDFGHVLIDGALPQSVPQIMANIEALGFKPTDVKAILLSHAHFDHAGGIADLQRLTGAQVYARRPAHEVLMRGKLNADDPQFGLKAPPIAPLKNAWILHDDQLLGVGSIRLRALATPGHTSGGASYTWESCARGTGEGCLTMVYADSLNPVSAKGFKFGAAEGNGAGAALAQSATRIESLKCDVIITAHPQASNLMERITKRGTNESAEAIMDEAGCKRYAEAARAALSERLKSE